MASVNKVIILGNLGKDPEVRYTTSGQAVASFSVATSERIKNKSGEYEERTEWHKIILWGKQAEIAGEYLAKGRTVYIEGRLQTRKWQDKDGNDRYSTEVVGERMQMVGGKESGGGSTAPAQQNNNQSSNRNTGSSNNANGAKSAAQTQQNNNDFGTFDDEEIPF